MTTFPHVRLTAAGTLGSGAGDEVWTCGLKVAIWDGVGGDPLMPTEQDLEDLVGPAQNAWAAYIGTTGLIYLAANLTHLYVTAIGADGLKLPDVDTVIFDYLSGVRGAAANDLVAPVYQVSIATTLRGAQYSRGLAAYGRFYPPTPALTDGTPGLVDGLVQTNVATNLANAAVTLIEAINATTLTSGNEATVANISNTAAAPRWQPVSSVQVDRRPDTQRRRANALESTVPVEVPIA